MYVQNFWLKRCLCFPAVQSMLSMAATVKTNRMFCHSWCCDALNKKKKKEEEKQGPIITERENPQHRCCEADVRGQGRAAAPGAGSWWKLIMWMGG